MSLRSDVAAFEERRAGLDARLVAVEAALGIPRPRAVVPVPVVAATPAADTAAARADVDQARAMLSAFTDDLGTLESRVALLEDALALFAPAARRGPHAAAPVPAAPEQPTDVVSRAELERLQKELVGEEDALAGIELRVAAAEDALDAFFGIAALR